MSDTDKAKQDAAEKRAAELEQSQERSVERDTDDRGFVKRDS